MLEDTRLKIFMAVADEGSFTRAAYLLGITQPAVSQNIASLEQETGRVLFERGRGSVRLTPDGERFRLYAARILRENAALDTAFSAADRPAVTLAATPSLLLSFIPSLLTRLSDRLPMRFSVRSLPEGSPAPGDADVSFYTAPCREELDFGSFPLGTLPAVCLTASEAVSPVSAPVLLWSPYRAACPASILGRVVLEADDPAFLLGRLRATDGGIALLPSLQDFPDFQLLPTPASLPVFEIRCKMKEAFAETESGKRFKHFLSL